MSYQYKVEDSINGLVIHYEGRQQWWLLILYLVIFGYVGYVGVDMILGILNKPSAVSITELLLIAAVGVLAMGYALIRLGLMVLDGLLNVEKVTINEREVIIEKSGFLNLERSKTFAVDDRLCFFRVPAGGIAFYKSANLARIYQRGFLKSSNINPMRRFGSNIAQGDAIDLLERIKTRFPQYEVFYK